MGTLNNEYGVANQFHVFVCHLVFVSKHVKPLLKAKNRNLTVHNIIVMVSCLGLSRTELMRSLQSCTL